ncbi:MAG TPA: hypothetical protein VNF68_15250 [Candidatus Baltobacteraceae bacterium]|nr:hypothetical protein [Candidatus Baltobacteraceae bacterium]
MKRPLPLWIFAAIPATLAGHALAYALGGRVMADGHHRWFGPLLECALALLLAVSLWLLGDVMVKARVLARDIIERNALRLWPRMAAAQVVLFLSIEGIEGTSIRWTDVAVQVLVALIAAYALGLFARVLEACARGTAQAVRYLERLRRANLSFAGREPSTQSIAATLIFGTFRWGRAPPSM